MDKPWNTKDAVKRPLQLGSVAGAKLILDIKATNLDPEFTGRYWRTETVYRVDNPVLQRRFDAYKADQLKQGLSLDSLDETFVFSAETEKACQDICQEGQKVWMRRRHVLGHTGSGVHLCRHYDILRRYMAYQNAGTPLFIIVYKVLLGKTKPIVPRLHKQDACVRPVAGFDSHVSARPVDPDMTICEALNCSYVYIFEHDQTSSNCVKYPRQILPYAIIHLEKKVPVVMEVPMNAVATHLTPTSHWEVKGETRRGYRFTLTKAALQRTLQKRIASKQTTKSAIRGPELHAKQLKEQLVEMRVGKSVKAVIDQPPILQKVSTVNQLHTPDISPGTSPPKLTPKSPMHEPMNSPEINPPKLSPTVPLGSQKTELSPGKALVTAEDETRDNASHKQAVENDTDKQSNDQATANDIHVSDNMCSVLESVSTQNLHCSVDQKKQLFDLKCCVKLKRLLVQNVYRTDEDETDTEFGDDPTNIKDGICKEDMVITTAVSHIGNKHRTPRKTDYFSRLKTANEKLCAQKSDEACKSVKQQGVDNLLLLSNVATNRAKKTDTPDVETAQAILGDKQNSKTKTSKRNRHSNLNQDIVLQKSTSPLAGVSAPDILNAFPDVSSARTMSVSSAECSSEDLVLDYVTGKLISDTSMTRHHGVKHPGDVKSKNCRVFKSNQKKTDSRSGVHIGQRTSNDSGNQNASINAESRSGVHIGQHTTKDGNQNVSINAESKTHGALKLKRRKKVNVRSKQISYIDVSDEAYHSQQTSAKSGGMSVVHSPTGANKAMPADSECQKSNRSDSNNKEVTAKEKATNDRSNSNNKEVTAKENATNDRSNSNNKEVTAKEKATNDRSNSNTMEVTAKEKATNDRSESNNKEVTAKEKATNDRSNSNNMEVTAKEKATNDRSDSNNKEVTAKEKATNDRSNSNNKEVTAKEKATNDRSDSNNMEVVAKENATNESNSNNKEVTAKENATNDRSNSNNKEVTAKEKATNDRSDSNNKEVTAKEKATNDRSNSNNKEVTAKEKPTNDRSDSNNKEVTAKEKATNDRSDSNNKEVTAKEKATNDRSDSNNMKVVAKEKTNVKPNIIPVVHSSTGAIKAVLVDSGTEGSMIGTLPLQHKDKDTKNKDKPVSANSSVATVSKNAMSPTNTTLSETNPSVPVFDVNTDVITQTEEHSNIKVTQKNTSNKTAPACNATKDNSMSVNRTEQVTKLSSSNASRKRKLVSDDDEPKPTKILNKADSKPDINKLSSKKDLHKPNGNIGSSESTSVAGAFKQTITSSKQSQCPSTRTIKQVDVKHKVSCDVPIQTPGGVEQTKDRAVVALKNSNVDITDSGDKNKMAVKGKTVEKGNPPVQTNQNDKPSHPTALAEPAAKERSDGASVVSVSRSMCHKDDYTVNSDNDSTRDAYQKLTIEEAERRILANMCLEAKASKDTKKTAKTKTNIVDKTSGQVTGKVDIKNTLQQTKHELDVRYTTAHEAMSSFKNDFVTGVRNDTKGFAKPTSSVVKVDKPMADRLRNFLSSTVAAAASHSRKTSPTATTKSLNSPKDNFDTMSSDKTEFACSGKKHTTTQNDNAISSDVPTSKHSPKHDVISSDVPTSKHSLKLDVISSDVPTSKHSPKHDVISPVVPNSKHSPKQDVISSDVPTSKHSPKHDVISSDVPTSKHSPKQNVISADVPNSKHSPKQDVISSDVPTSKHSPKHDVISLDVPTSKHSPKQDVISTVVPTSKHSPKQDVISTVVPTSKHSPKQDVISSDVPTSKHSPKQDVISTVVPTSKHSPKHDVISSDVPTSKHSPKQDVISTVVPTSKHSPKQDVISTVVPTSKHSPKQDVISPVVPTSKHSPKQDVISPVVPTSKHSPTVVAISSNTTTPHKSTDIVRVTNTQSDHNPIPHYIANLKSEISFENEAQSNEDSTFTAESPATGEAGTNEDPREQLMFQSVAAVKLECPPDDEARSMEVSTTPETRTDAVTITNVRSINSKATLVTMPTVTVKLESPTCDSAMQGTEVKSPNFDDCPKLVDKVPVRLDESKIDHQTKDNGIQCKTSNETLADIPEKKSDTPDKNTDISSADIEVSDRNIEIKSEPEPQTSGSTDRKPQTRKAKQTKPVDCRAALVESLKELSTVLEFLTNNSKSRTSRVDPQNVTNVNTVQSGLGGAHTDEDNAPVVIKQEPLDIGYSEDAVVEHPPDNNKNSSTMVAVKTELSDEYQSETNIINSPGKILSAQEKNAHEPKAHQCTQPKEEEGAGVCLTVKNTYSEDALPSVFDHSGEPDISGIEAFGVPKPSDVNLNMATLPSVCPVTIANTVTRSATAVSSTIKSPVNINTTVTCPDITNLGIPTLITPKPTNSSPPTKPPAKGSLQKPGLLNKGVRQRKHMFDLKIHSKRQEMSVKPYSMSKKPCLPEQHTIAPNNALLSASLQADPLVALCHSGTNEAPPNKNSSPLKPAVRPNVTGSLETPAPQSVSQSLVKRDVFDHGAVRTSNASPLVSPETLVTPEHVSQCHVQKVATVGVSSPLERPVVPQNVLQWPTTKVTAVGVSSPLERPVVPQNVLQWPTTKVTAVGVSSPLERPVVPQNVLQWPTTKVTAVGVSSPLERPVVPQNVLQWPTTKVTAVGVSSPLERPVVPQNVLQWPTTKVTAVSGPSASERPVASHSLPPWPTNFIATLGGSSQPERPVASHSLPQWQSTFIAAMTGSSQPEAPVTVVQRSLIQFPLRQTRPFNISTSSLIPIVPENVLPSPTIHTVTRNVEPLPQQIPVITNTRVKQNTAPAKWRPGKKAKGRKTGQPCGTPRYEDKNDGLNAKTHSESTSSRDAECQKSDRNDDNNKEGIASNKTSSDNSQPKDDVNHTPSPKRKSKSTSPAILPFNKLMTHKKEYQYLQTVKKKAFLDKYRNHKAKAYGAKFSKTPLPYNHWKGRVFGVNRFGENKLGRPFQHRPTNLTSPARRMNKQRSPHLNKHSPNKSKHSVESRRSGSPDKTSNDVDRTVVKPHVGPGKRCTISERSTALIEDIDTDPLPTKGYSSFNHKPYFNKTQPHRPYFNKSKTGFFSWKRKYQPRTDAPRFGNFGYNRLRGRSPGHVRRETPIEHHPRDNEDLRVQIEDTLRQIQGNMQYKHSDQNKGSDRAGVSLYMSEQRNDKYRNDHQRSGDVFDTLTKEPDYNKQQSYALDVQDAGDILRGIGHHADALNDMLNQHMRRHYEHMTKQIKEELMKQLTQGITSGPQPTTNRNNTNNEEWLAFDEQDRRRSFDPPSRNSSMERSSVDRHYSHMAPEHRSPYPIDHRGAPNRRSPSRDSRCSHDNRSSRSHSYDDHPPPPPRMHEVQPRRPHDDEYHDHQRRPFNPMFRGRGGPRRPFRPFYRTFGGDRDFRFKPGWRGGFSQRRPMRGHIHRPFGTHKVWPRAGKEHIHSNPIHVKLEPPEYREYNDDVGARCGSMDNTFFEERGVRIYDRSGQGNSDRYPNDRYEEGIRDNRRMGDGRSEDMGRPRRNWRSDSRERKSRSNERKRCHARDGDQPGGENRNENDSDSHCRERSGEGEEDGMGCRWDNDEWIEDMHVKHEKDDTRNESDKHHTSTKTDLSNRNKRDDHKNNSYSKRSTDRKFGSDRESRSRGRSSGKHDNERHSSEKKGGSRKHREKHHRHSRDHSAARLKKKKSDSHRSRDRSDDRKSDGKHRRRVSDSIKHSKRSHTTSYHDETKEKHNSKHTDGDFNHRSVRRSSYDPVPPSKKRYQPAKYSRPSGD